MVPFVRNAWYVAAWHDDLQDGKPYPISILNERIVLFRTPTGRVVALEDRCVHRHAPLSLGRCEGENLRCMYHGLLYNSYGRVIEIPGQAKIPDHARIRIYQAVERHSWIWVWMGDPTRADEALIPAAIGYDNPDWILGHGRIDYAADARLINDNLLDFSHLTYVHANSFQAGDEFANERPTISALPRGVRFDRWLQNKPALTDRNNSERFDFWSSYDFLVPGILLMWSGLFPAGTARACELKRPDYSLAVRDVTFTSQAVTSLTDKTARYFFSWGPHRKHGDAALRGTLMKIAQVAFDEDRTMIEAQQRVIDQASPAQIMPTTADRGVTLFNQILRRLARDDVDKAPTNSSPKPDQTAAVSA
jgi:vanillate O-demethylase monooxygenase subunit